MDWLRRSCDSFFHREGGETALSRHQSEQWDPLLKWAEGFGLALTPTESIIAIKQSDEAYEVAKDLISKLDDLRLTLAVHFIATLGSAVWVSQS